MRLVVCHHRAHPELDWRPLGRLRSGGVVDYEISADLGVVLVRCDDWARQLAGDALGVELRELVEGRLGVPVENAPVVDE